MKTISMTGVTGFLGASLATRLLHSGWRVIALSRRDFDEARTRGAIQEALNGFNMMLPDSHWANLVVIDPAHRPLHTCLEDPRVGESDVFWHGAAERPSSTATCQRLSAPMCVSPPRCIRRSGRSRQNASVFITSQQLIRAAWGRIVLEELHTSYPRINAYQTHPNGALNMP